ncbi:MAG: tyrosine-type recombinase/integrase, partial [Patescibacteria group bacterium]|nr:tyrosine-type recombinase/integrase [Patescibacteria group bacterium]
KLWREAAMVSLIYDNGLRAASLVAIRNEDVDWEENVIQLQHVKGGKELPVPFGDATWRRLDRWRRHRLDKKSPWLFTGSRGKLTANGVYQIISKVFEGMGIEHVGPHLIRHSFAAAYMSDDSAQWQDLKEVGLWSSDTMPQRYARMAKRQRARVAHRRLSPVERLASMTDEVG